MDKYEYKVRADEIRALIQERKYKEAVEIADTIDWRNVKNSMMLCTISDLYKMCKRFEDSRDVLFLAYQRNPGGRMILYSLCELSIKLGDIVNAIEYLKEFKQVAPRDPGRLILKYKLYTAEEVSLEERIEVLEELQQYDCKEKWMYELAYLYHMQGVSEKCVEECNQIAIYFGEGKYVVKALELKALHEPLSAEQDALYRRLTGPKENDILVKDMDVSKFNTIDLQKELANSMAEVFFNDNEKPQAEPTVQEVSEPVEEVVEEVYDDITTMIPPIEETPVSEPETPEVEEAEADDITTVIPPITEPVKEDKEEPSDETVIYNINDLDSALKKEPGVARTVIPKQGRFDDMHEVMPKATNNPAIVFPNYDDMVSLEGDGQISFNIPDQEIVDKQITGQISIEDVLAEWERLRSANEKAWRENMHRKVLQQTSTLFKDFDESARNGLLEQLEEEVETSPTVELTTEEAARLGIEIEEDAEPDETADTEETPETTAVEESFFDDTEVTKVLPASEVIASLAAENVVPEEILTVSDVDTDTDSDSQSSDIREIVIDEEEPTAEELSFDRTPYVQEEDNTEEVSEAKEEEPVAEEPTEEQTFEDNGYLEAFAEASEERDAYDREFLQEEEPAEEETTEPEVTEEPATEEVVEEVKEEIAEEVEEEPVEAELPKTDVKLYEFKALDAVEETVAEVEEAVSEEIPVEEAESSEEEAEVAESEPEQDTVEEEPEEVQEEPVQEPETAEVEEPVTEEPAEEPEQEADTAESYETDAESAEPEKPVIRPSGFTAEQEERFESFIQLEDGRKRLKEVIEKISTDSSHGNVIIGSEDLDSAIELAKGLIMELSSKEEISGKVAKIKASTLNAKDADETLSKLYGGALIIQDAHELRRETLDAVRRILSANDKKLFIVLTCLRRSKHKFISDNSDMLGNFDVSYDIEALNNKELAAYAKAYALSRDYTIDEMGMLALHTRIDSKQTNEHSVTVTEVRDLVDEAIARSTKKNAKYFLDVLMGKRYDENDMVVLKEKDFAEK